MSAAAVILAAGSGTRVGARVNKILLELAGVAVVARSVLDALATSEVSRVVLVVRAGEEQAISEALVPHLHDQEVMLVAGGETRHASEWAAVRLLAPYVASGEVDVIAIHDGARPLAGSPLWQRTIEAAREHGGAIPVVEVDHLVRADFSGAPLRTLGAVQTPQAFRAAALVDSYTRAASDGFEGTDTAACLAAYSETRVAAVAGSPLNIKVTFPEDVALAEALLA